MTAFARGLVTSRALQGVEVLAGSASLPRQTSPNRIVVFPANGEWEQPGDKSVSIFDVEQQVVVEIWGKGSSTGANNEAAFADWNAAWQLLVAFVQALVEQGESPKNPTSPGAFWEVVAGPSWSTAEDATQQGVAIKVLCAARCPIPAAPDDEGHVGDNWAQGGPVAGVEIDGEPA